MSRIDNLAFIAVGGAAGALVRWFIAEAWATSTFPWPTLVVNVVGCALLAVVTADGVPKQMRRLLGAGFCGGLTTFSTLTVEVVRLIDGGNAATAVVYTVASVVLGLAAYIGARSMRPTRPLGAKP